MFSAYPNPVSHFTYNGLNLTPHSFPARPVGQHVQGRSAFKTVYSKAMEYLTSGSGLFLVFGDPVKRTRARKLIEEACGRTDPQ